MSVDVDRSDWQVHPICLAVVGYVSMEYRIQSRSTEQRYHEIVYNLC